ncbi:CCA tRNA nucleotidyltransferase [Sphingorhabdus sp.]|jgi:poly(A) polymerase|uniref:CCA tRNA nucleotidyltransferase n=1 Tax=Sphingorhabdus sp. TaxID=1902408 RepID=UPI0037843684
MTPARLPDSAWQHADGLKKILAALDDAYGGPRYVGGAVRDTLLGLPVSDIDIATALLPNEVINRLQDAGIKAIPTGIEHGTVTAAVDGKNYEITTLRRDVATDGRRATVAFATDWQEDAARRDFTINALYAAPKSGEVFDYFDGLNDLEARRLRFIGDANQRIAEDFLRILRYFRFLARYGGGQMDADAIQACANGAHGLTALSRERIAQELTRILALKDPVASVALMIANGIFTPFLPELSASAANDLQRLVEREAQYAQPVSLPARFLALLTRDIVAVDKVAARLKLSNKMREGFAQRLRADAPTPANIRAIAYRADIDTARDAAMLYAGEADLPECLARLEQWDIPTLSIKGGELIAMGLPAGPMVAKTLQAVEAAWIEADFPDAARQRALATQMVNAALPRKT